MFCYVSLSPGDQFCCLAILLSVFSFCQVTSNADALRLITQWWGRLHDDPKERVRWNQTVPCVLF